MNLASLSAMKDAVANSPQWLRYVLVLVAGMAIGAVFYPTKSIEEKLRVEYEQKMTQSEEAHKHVEESLKESLVMSQKESKNLQVTTSSKIAKLTTENSQLKSKKTETYYKIVHPDGTIEIRSQKATETDQSNQVVISVKQEYEQKVKDLETKYATIHKERVQQIQEDFSKKEEKYQETIASLQKDKTVEINAKKYGVEVGYLSNKDYYGHVNIDVVGPIFLGLQTQTNFSNSNAVGAGVGIRF